MAVYFILNVDKDLIKIGYSFKVAERLKQLSKQSEESLTLLGVMSGDHNAEQELHTLFDENRVNGEWFRSNNELLHFIDKNAITLDELNEEVIKEGVIKGSGLQSRVKILAQEQGYKTPEALSKPLGLTRSTIYNVWTGDIANRKISTLFLIADVLNVPMDQLFETVED